MAGLSIELDSILKGGDALAHDIASMWSRWKAAKAGHENDTADVIKYVFAVSNRELSGGADWNHSTHLPKIASLYDTLKANYVEGLMPNRRWMRIEGEDDKALRRDFQRKVEGYIRTKHRVRGFRAKVADLLDDWILDGNCFVEVFYADERATDPTTGATRILYQGPDIRRISPNDICVNPLATDFASSPKVIRTLKTIGDIRRDVEDGVISGDQWDMEQIDALLDLRSTLSGCAAEDINKSSQLQVDGYGTPAQYLQGDTIEMLDLYGDIYDKSTGVYLRNQVVTVMDRTWVVRKAQIPTWNGKPMIFHSGWRKRRDNIMGQGPLSNLIGMQYRINHLENARADMFDEMLNGDLVLLGDIQTMYGENNQKIYAGPEGGAVRRLAPDTTVLNADFQIQALEAKMDAYAGAPREASGFRTPGEKTKFEVSQLMTAGAKLFQHKLGDFEDEILGNVLNAQIEIAAKTLTGRDTARMDDDSSGVKEIAEVTSDDLSFNGRIIPIGSRHYARQAQLAQEFRVFHDAISADKEVAQHFPPKRIARMWEEVLAIEEYELYDPFGRIAEQAEAAQKASAAQEVVRGTDEAGGVADGQAMQ